MVISSQWWGISQQLWIRFFSLLAFSGLFTRHVLYLPSYLSYSNQISGVMLWVLEASILFGYCVAYSLRNSAVSQATGWKELVFPFLPACLPFLFFLELDFSLPLQISKIFGASVIRYPDYLWHSLIFIFVGNFVSSIGLWTLRANFSIATECRQLVRYGIYRYVSHPMYVGQFITFFGVVFVRMTPQKVFLYMLFVALQWIRLKNEEKKLKHNFKEYEEHLRACWIRL